MVSSSTVNDMSLLASVFLPLALSFFTLFILAGWGSLGKLIFQAPSNINSFSSDVLFGVFFVTLSIELIHFFYPINIIVSLGIFGVGITLFFQQKKYVNILKDVLSFIKVQPYLSLSFLGILVYWCLRITKLSTNYDTAAYHLQIIRMINEYPIIPGVANLWTHLGLNQSYFEFLALLKFFPYFNGGYVVGGLLFFVLTCLVLIERRKERFINFAWLSFILYLITHSPGSTLFSPTPDLIVGLIEIIIFSYAISFLNALHQKFLTMHYVSIILVLSSFLFTVKLIGAIYAFSIALMLVTYSLLRFKKESVFLLKPMCVCLILILAHLISGYLLSGYPLFPSTFGGIQSLPWSTPAEVGERLVATIHNTTRDPKGLLNGKHLVNFRDWGPVWIKTLSISMWIYFILGAFLTLFNFQRAFSKKNLNEYTPILIFLIFPSLSGIIFWFNSAPEFRYLGAVFEIFISSSFLLCLSLAPQNTYLVKFNSLNFLKGLTLIMLVCILLSLNKGLLRGWDKLPIVQLKEASTQSGFLINIPDHELCWDSTLFCMYEFDPKLSLIKKEDISSGFTVKK
jgi:hypothetical protein